MRESAIARFYARFVFGPREPAQAELKNLSLTLKACRPEETLNEISERLAKASRVTFISFRNACNPWPLHFRQQSLQQVPSFCRLPHCFYEIFRPWCNPCVTPCLVDDPTTYILEQTEVCRLAGPLRRRHQFKQIVKALQSDTINAVFEYLSQDSTNGHLYFTNIDFSMSATCASPHSIKVFANSSTHREK